MTDDMKDIKDKVKGNLDFPDEWVVFAPFPFQGLEPEFSADVLEETPEELTLKGKTIRPEKIKPERHQYNFRTFFGDPPYKDTRAAYVFVPLHSDSEQEVTLGAGGDWYMQVWLNGNLLLDTLEEGNKFSPPAINNYLLDAEVKKGHNVLAVRFIHGKGASVLALGGPEELREGDFESIMPPSDSELSGEEIMKKYPADPNSPITWRVPEGFNPREPGLGLPKLEETEHFELMHALRSNSPFDEGGTGEYESLCHGTWNHNIAPVIHYRDFLIGVWDNHACDENGPGSRVLAKVGKIINEEGEVDWGGEESMVEAAPPAVPVRRRREKFDRDTIRGAQAGGSFRVIGDRLLFCGGLSALHGVTTVKPRNIDFGQVLEPDQFFFAKGAYAPNAAYARWDFGFRFFQEWGPVNGRLKPISPLYKNGELPEKLQVTTELALPLEPLIPPYSDAPLLPEAPSEFRELVELSGGTNHSRVPKFNPDAFGQAADGNNGIIGGHGSSFRRRDGQWVAVAENTASGAGPFYYSAEKSESAPYFPPPYRSNLFGAVKPAAGELPDERNYIICNWRRRNMYLVVSEDGRCFDKTWLLRYKELAEHTPGAMKSQGGPGSGPQYFKSAVVGNSLWSVYSISKEHISATRVPVSAL